METALANGCFPTVISRHHERQYNRKKHEKWE